MRLLTPCLLGLLLSIFCPLASADEFYGSAGIQQNRIQVGDSSFSLYGPTGQIGRWLREGIGLEFSATVAATNDRQNDVTIEMDHLLSAGIRFESPTAGSNTTAAYVLGGVAAANIAGVTNVAAAGSVGASGSYTGLFFGVGLLHSVLSRGYLSVDVAYYKLDSQIGIPSIRLGFRQSF